MMDGRQLVDDECMSINVINDHIDWLGIDVDKTTNRQ